MKRKHLIQLVAITLVIIGITWWVLPPQHPVSSSSGQQYLFPELLKQLNEVTEINIVTADQSFTITRSDGHWGLQEKQGYAVNLEKVRDLLIGMGELQIVEEKTTNPKLYEKLGLNEVTEKGSTAVLVTLKKGPDQVIANLLVGNTQPAKVDSSRHEAYVRKPTEKQTLLAMGLSPIAKSSKDWLEQVIVDIEQKRIHLVKVTHADGYEFSISKPAVKDSDYQLNNVPAGQQPKISPHDFNQMAGMLSRLNLTDVVPEQQIDFEKNLTYKAVFSSFDGLEVTLVAAHQDGKQFAKLAVASIPVVEKASSTGESAADAEKTTEETGNNDSESTTFLKVEEEVKKEIETLQSRWQGWAFEVPQYKFNTLLKKEADLLEAKKEAEPAQDSSGGSVVNWDALQGNKEPDELGQPATTSPDDSSVSVPKNDSVSSESEVETESTNETTD